MAGSGDLTQNNDLSFLQTPTYQIVTVFVCLIITSLIVNGLLSRAKTRIDVTSSKGMTNAYNAVLHELVLLGFLSFMLEIFGPEISKICIDMYSQHSIGYWFARCPVDYIGGQKAKPLETLYMPPPPSYTSTSTSLFERFFKVDFDGCHYDKQPFASQQALHETHYLLFLIGFVRILAIIVLVYSSHFKLRKWKKAFREMKVLRALEGILQSSFINNTFQKKKSLKSSGSFTVGSQFEEKSKESKLTSSIHAKTSDSNIENVSTDNNQEMVIKDKRKSKRHSLEPREILDMVVKKEIEIAAAAEEFEVSKKEFHKVRTKSETETLSTKRPTVYNVRNRSGTQPEQRRTDRSSIISSAEVAQEQENSWCRISSLQLRRMSVDIDTLKELDKDNDRQSMTQKARRISVLAGQAEEIVKEEFDIEEKQLLSQLETKTKTLKETRENKVSRIHETEFEQEGEDVDAIKRDRSSTIEQVAAQDYSKCAIDAAVERRQQKAKEIIKAGGRKGIRKRLFFFLPDFTRHVIIQKKTALFLDDMVEYERKRNLHSQKGSTADTSETESIDMSYLRYRRASIGGIAIPPANMVEVSFWNCLKYQIRDIYYSLQLQGLLFARQFTHGVTKGDVDEARKSFIRKHELPCDFEFLEYTQHSVDEDLADVIEVHWIEWLVGMIYLFGIGLEDSFALQFWVPLFGILLITLVGLQIQNVIFHVAALRIDDQYTTDSHFWFGRPRNMLWMLRISVSIFSFDTAFIFFITWKEGLKSCYFDLWSLSWFWLLYSLGVTLIGVSYIGYILLPQYSLAVEMGNSYRKDVLKNLLIDKINEKVVGDVDTMNRQKRKMAYASQSKDEKKSNVLNNDHGESPSKSLNRNNNNGVKTAESGTEELTMELKARTQNPLMGCRKTNLVEYYKMIGRTPDFVRNAAAREIQYRWRTFRNKAKYK